MSDSGAGKVLVDTNVLVYCYDEDDPAKNKIAKELVREHLRARTMAITPQVLNEFVAAITKPSRPQPMSWERVDRVAGYYHRFCHMLPFGPHTTFKAINGAYRHGLSFWDALIWASAREAGVPLILTEDFQHGREVEGVKFINPFLSTSPSVPAP